MKFENEYVRVMDIIIPPGESTLLHTHAQDLAGVTIADAPTRSEVRGKPPEDSPAGKPGEVWFEPFGSKPVTHRVTNTGGATIHYVAAELLSPVPRRTGTTSGATPPGHIVELENKRVRITRLVLSPGQSTGMHTHALRGLGVAVSAGEIVIEVPGKKSEKVRFEPGMSVWHEGGLTHSLKNVGTAPFEVVDIEIK